MRHRVIRPYRFPIPLDETRGEFIPEVLEREAEKVGKALKNKFKKKPESTGAFAGAYATKSPIENEEAYYMMKLLNKYKTQIKRRRKEELVRSRERLMNERKEEPLHFTGPKGETLYKRSWRDI